MQVLCVTTEDSADVSCKICGHQYKLYFERQSAAERAEALSHVEETLANHHALSSAMDGDTNAVHPNKPFNVPEWSGPAEWSAAALLGGAPA